MLLFALIAAAALQTPYAEAGGGQTYQPPRVRPFEPPSDFGRETAQGDASGDLHRRPIEAPVAVEAYRRSYETSPTDAELAYEQGVAQAELNADAMAGPLDGRWRVTDADGRALLSLALVDHGSDQPVEGAWRASGEEPLSGAVAAVEQDEAGVVVALGGREGRLALRRTASGWAGTLERDGRRTPVTVGRPS